MYNQTLYDDPYLFTDSNNNATKAKRGKFKETRHDQSVFSVIRKLFPEDTFVIPNETNPKRSKIVVPFAALQARGFSQPKDGPTDRKKRDKADRKKRDAR
jgi:hypothetical protein